MRIATRRMTWVVLGILCLAGLAAGPVLSSPETVPGLKIDKKSIGGTVTNISAGSGMTLLSANIAWNAQGLPSASEYYVQTTAASINPSAVLPFSGNTA